MYDYVKMIEQPVVMLAEVNVHSYTNKSSLRSPESALPVTNLARISKALPFAFASRMLMLYTLSPVFLSASFFSLSEQGVFPEY